MKWTCFKDLFIYGFSQCQSAHSGSSYVERRQNGMMICSSVIPHTSERLLTTFYLERQQQEGHTSDELSNIFPSNVRTHSNNLSAIQSSSGVQPKENLFGCALQLHAATQLLSFLRSELIESRSLLYSLLRQFCLLRCA